MHARFAPKAHRFVYRIFLFALDLDELETLDRRLRLFSFDRAGLYSFRDQDYLPTSEPVCNGRAGPPGPPSSEPARPAVAPYLSLKQRVVDCLSKQGIDLTGGRVTLVTLPRVAGYLFNPVSFYFCHDRAGTPVAAIAEVTNTFREMKTFLLGPETLTPDGFRLRVPKHFYVSPFSDVDVAFDFTLRPPGDRLSVQIDDYIGAARTLTSTLTGPRQPLTDTRLAWFTLKYPFITLKVIALIHWHALRLWWKNVPWYCKTARAADQRDLRRPHASIARPPSSARMPATPGLLTPSPKA
jgi:DUF1365 family protein